MDAQLDRCSGTSLLDVEEDELIVLGLLLVPLLGTKLSVWLQKLEMDPDDCLLTKLFCCDTWCDF